MVSVGVVIVLTVLFFFLLFAIYYLWKYRRAVGKLTKLLKRCLFPKQKRSKLTANSGCCGIIRPSPKRKTKQVEKFKTLSSEGFLCCLHNCVLCWNGYCCCPFSFADGLSLEDAISRYEEVPNLSPAEVIKKISKDLTLATILEFLNLRQPKFFFRVLPSGSIREGFGRIRPSSSVLATDYDLMLIPDSIYAYNKDSSKQNEKFPQTFIVVDDPNQNPDRRSGYLWLEFVQPDLQAWQKLTYERLSQDGVKYYLSQQAVLNMISNELDNRAFLELLRLITGYTRGDFQNLRVDTNITGPALNIKIKAAKGKDDEDDDMLVLFDADFTLAISFPEFPRAGMYFFQRREMCYWPPVNVVEQIRNLGCHIVPKASSKLMTTYQEEQMLESYLGVAHSLEWRYSFSQAEMLLSDNVPRHARISYLAFKAMIKIHINQALDHENKSHSIQSYALKTILFYELEKLPPSYWDEDNNKDAKTNFFGILLSSLIEKVEMKHCPHYWIDGLNLFEEKDEADFAFFKYQLEKIKKKPVRYIASDWLEWNRYLQRNCCDSCIYHGEEYSIVIENEPRKPWCICGKISCACLRECKGACDCGRPLVHDPVVLEIY